MGKCTKRWRRSGQKNIQKTCPSSTISQIFLIVLGIFKFCLMLLVHYNLLVDLVLVYEETIKKYIYKFARTSHCPNKREFILFLNHTSHINNIIFLCFKKIFKKKLYFNTFLLRSMNLLFTIINI